MNHTLAPLFDQFLKERTPLQNVMRTLCWYRIAFKSYRRALGTATLDLPTKNTLQQFVIHERDRGIKPVTVGCRW